MRQDENLTFAVVSRQTIKHSSLRSRRPLLINVPVMKANTILAVLFLFICASSEGCHASKNDESLIQQLYSGNTEEMHYVAQKFGLLGRDGIPILLEALSKSLENTFVLSNYARSNICISTLHSLAQDQIFIEDEVPVLIDALIKQASIEDTYLTAGTLRLITGVDTGYTKEFIEKYSTDNETERLKKNDVAKMVG